MARFPPRNILAKYSILELCIGRRNWMYSDTPKDAYVSPLYYSLTETTKANGLEQHKY